MQIKTVFCLSANHPDLLLFQATEVDTWVLKITAEDVDILPEYSGVTYSFVMYNPHAVKQRYICNDTYHHITYGHRVHESAKASTAKAQCFV